jgi:hypothetical protein
MKALRISAALALIACVFIAANFAAAASVPSVNSIIVNPNPPYQSMIWSDRGNYNIGEKIEIGFRVSRDSYVYVFSIDANGIVRMIFPNIYSNDNKVKAERSYSLPDNNKYNLTIGGPTGTDQLVLISTPSRIKDTDWLARSLNTNNFAPQININIAADGFMAQIKSVIITPVYRNDWSSAYASYMVGGTGSGIIPPVVPFLFVAPPAVAPPVGIPPAIIPSQQGAGSMHIASNPAGARVFINGVDKGITPMNVLNLNYGEYEFTMILPDYYAYTGRVTISNWNPQNVYAALTKIPNSSQGNFVNLLVDKQITVGWPNAGPFIENFNYGTYSGSVAIHGETILGMMTRIIAKVGYGAGSTLQIGVIAPFGLDAPYFGKVLEYDMRPFKVRITVLDFTTVKGSLTGTYYLGDVKLLLEIYYIG